MWQSEPPSKKEKKKINKPSGEVDQEKMKKQKLLRSNRIFSNTRLSWRFCVNTFKNLDGTDKLKNTIKIDKQNTIYQYG